MNWFWFTIGVLGGFYLLGSKRGRTLKRKARRKAVPPEKTFTPQDRVKRAMETGNVEVMVSALAEADAPELRNLLLSEIVAIYYRQRSEPAARDKFYRYAGQHIEEIPSVLEVLEKSEAGRPNRIDSFKMIAIAMAEDERYNEAIDICKTALSLGLDDGTKTGFEGRITRIKRKRDAGD
jgi:hypothetical protein